MGKMTIDVIIPTYKPDETFSLLLQKLRQQTYAVHKVIVMNTEKRYWDAFVEKCKMQPVLDELQVQVQHIKKEAFDHGGTRCAGVALSDADAFVCMTQDAIPADIYLIEELVRALETGESQNRSCQVAAAYARQLPAVDCSLIEQYVRQFNYPDISRVKTKRDIKELGIKTFFCSNVCAAYDRKLFDQLGGFEQHTIFNEDMIYAGHAVKAGYAIAYAAEACVVHSHNYTADQQFHRYFDLAVSQRQHPEVFANVKSESEGMKLVIQTARFLLRSGKPLLLFTLFTQNLAKIRGYRKGLNYDKMTKKQILNCTMNKEFWRR